MDLFVKGTNNAMAFLDKVAKQDEEQRSVCTPAASLYLMVFCTIYAVSLTEIPRTLGQHFNGSQRSGENTSVDKTNCMFI